MTTMQAATYSGGQRFEVVEVETPELQPGGVLVRVRNCGICGSDLHIYRGEFPAAPDMRMGHEIAGEVAAVGEGVSGLEIGQAVAIEPVEVCRQCDLCVSGRYQLCPERKFLGIMLPGAFAEYVHVPSYTVHPLPDGVDTEVGSLVEPLAVSVHGLRQVGLSFGERVLVLGSGTIGLMALVAARALGASDVFVTARYPHQAEAALAQADIPVASFTVPPGEASKSLETASAIYDWLIEQRAERGHAIVALGGGMVTDLAGFVAATYARGLPLVHVPTSLLAMVDAAIGGKVAVNHPRSKNAIGAFYQPRFVLADVSTLRTLPPRELSGWAEAIKHAMILDADLLAFFEEHVDAVLRLEPGPTTEAIQRNVAIKATVVSEDEREETGRRTILNYGHTVGHAIEAVSGYERFRHGEADAIGMTAAAAISRRLGLMSADVERRQRALLERFGLPTSAEGLDRGDLLSAMALDKKVRAGAIRWVLLEDVGRTVLRDDVPRRVVEEALDEVLA